MYGPRPTGFKNSFRNIVYALGFSVPYYFGTAVTFGIFYYLLGRITVGLIIHLLKGIDNGFSVIITLVFASIFTLAILTLILFKVFFIPQVKPTALEIKQSSYPEIQKLLSSVLDQVVHSLNTTPFNRIFITSEVDAFVYETFFLRRKRNLVIGWPLLYALSAEQLKAVIAHELAHFDDNGGFLLQMLTRTHRSIDNSLTTLGWWDIVGERARVEHEKADHSIKHLTIFYPLYRFTWYSSIIVKLISIPYFLWLKPFYALLQRQTQRLSHEAEHYCDAISATYYGNDAIVKGLQGYIVANVAFERAISDTVRIKKDKNYYPSFLNHLFAVQQELTFEDFEALMPESYDHPSLRNRIAFLEDYTSNPDMSRPTLNKYQQFTSFEEELTKLFFLEMVFLENDDEEIRSDNWNRTRTVTGVVATEQQCPRCKKIFSVSAFINDKCPDCQAQVVLVKESQYKKSKTTPYGLLAAFGMITALVLPFIGIPICLFVLWRTQEEKARRLAKIGLVLGVLPFACLTFSFCAISLANLL